MSTEGIKWNDIYSKTYNFVYIRAKAMLGDEQEARKLMQDAYVDFYGDGTPATDEKLYEDLGKAVYRLGCHRLQEKRPKEATKLELTKDEVTAGGSDLTKETAEQAGNVFEKMPDLYFATAIAFYYDYLTIAEIAGLFDCTEGCIRYRLNYAKKCLADSLGEQYAFSAAIMQSVIRSWATEHCIGVTGAQNVYSEICAVIGAESEPIHLGGKDFAGINHTVVYRTQDPMAHLLDEITDTDQKKRKEHKLSPRMAGLLLCAFAVVIAAGILISRQTRKAPATADQTGSETKLQTDTDQTDTDQADTDQTDTDQTDTDKTDADKTVVDEPKVDEPAAAQPEPDKDDTYLFADSDKVLLSKSALQKCTKKQLRLARNEIYARYGVIFGVKDLDTYFGGKSWYTPKMSITDFYDKVEMNEVEEENIIRIQAVEKTK